MRAAPRTPEQRAIAVLLLALLEEGVVVEVEVARLEVGVAGARLTFTGSAAQPFHHFALLAPGNRFEAGHAWLAERVELLPARETSNTVFPFDFWDALACYFHDPAGNIVELIAHRGLGEAPDARADFRGSELLGISEIGLVTADPAGAARVLRDDLGLELWSGAVPTDASGLGFVGRKAHTLILSMPGRGWMPTGRPAEPHRVDVTLSGAPARAATLPGTPHRVRRVP
jgi:catechol 2,3-dioxygenase-like lactoylglutathione lyase family enzyme